MFDSVKWFYDTPKYHISQCNDLTQTHKTTANRTHAQKGKNIVVGAKKCRNRRNELSFSKSSFLVSDEETNSLFDVSSVFVPFSV